MTSIQDKIIKPKLGLLELAKQLGSVSQACRVMGYSRDSFYRFKELYEQGGEQALMDLSRRKPVLKNRGPEHVEQAVIELAIENPALGQKRASWELQQQGIMVSSSGVRSIWLLNDLETMKKRLKALEALAAQDGILLTERRSQALGCTFRHDVRVAHLGIGDDASSPHSHDRTRWQSFTGRLQMGRLQAGVLFTRPCPVAAVSPSVHRRVDGTAPHRAACFLRRPEGTGGCRGLCQIPRTAAQNRMDGLCQTALRRTRAGAGLSQPLHPPWRHLQQPPHQRGCPGGGLSLERLPRQIRRPPKGHAPEHRRVHPPVPDPRPAPFRQIWLCQIACRAMDGFHRIRHYGLQASFARKANIAKIRQLLEVEQTPEPKESTEIIPLTLREPCPDCGGPMRIIEIFRRGQKPTTRAPPRNQAA
ncbi:helix-turn-helix domain-containing protein [Leisingera sp. M523]|nr:helix-turn-helix domain-containing protein [Leisingera sp. M523]